MSDICFPIQQRLSVNYRTGSGDQHGVAIAYKQGNNLEQYLVADFSTDMAPEWVDADRIIKAGVRLPPQPKA